MPERSIRLPFAHGEIHVRTTSYPIGATEEERDTVYSEVGVGDDERMIDKLFGFAVDHVNEVLPTAITNFADDLGQPGSTDVEETVRLDVMGTTFELALGCKLHDIAVNPEVLKGVLVTVVGPEMFREVVGFLAITEMAAAFADSGYAEIYLARRHEKAIKDFRRLFGGDNTPDFGADREPEPETIH